ncbi:MAG TPA: right-handed parallel beta-helix repeat-containing protein [Anaerolinea sp.]|nr:right-handed parallel beta-helix repeat-containing protein [Anaerolinea sp.]
MKRLLQIWLACACALSLCGMAPAPKVTLTAAQVTSAQDIEAAINQATGNGAHPGTVVLDGRMGDFVYTGDDRSINIFRSGVKLLGRSGATIANCADGIFFDGLPADDIFIEGITFECDGSGLVSVEYPHRRVTLSGNTFTAEGNGLELSALERWKITGNRVSGHWAIHLGAGSTDVQVTQNQLIGFIGVYLQNVDGAKVTRNQIRADWQGILLGAGADRNQIDANRITGVEASGIALEGDNSGNRIHGNRVACLSGAECLLVDAAQALYGTNQISGNFWLK